MNADARKHVTALMTRLADGDRSVFDEVYAALRPVVTAFCAKMLTGADAEDVAQLALLKVFERASTFEATGDAFTWVLAIATWEVRTVQKQMVRGRTAPLDDHDPADPAENAESLLAREQLITSARQVLGTLSESDQQTLLASFGDAKPTGVADATFRKRRERALTRLKDAWRAIYGN